MSDPNRKTSLDQARQMLDNAVTVSVLSEIRAEAERAEAELSPAPASSNAPSPPNSTRAENSHLPEDCPIKPLGVAEGVFFYLDALGQIRDLEGSKHSRLGIQALFGEEIDFLHHHWPRTNDDGKANGWRPEQASEALMKAAAAKGIWSSSEKLRGCGAWRGDGGELIFHCGDIIWVGPTTDGSAGQWLVPGCIDGYVYPAAAAQPRPAAKIEPSDPGKVLLDLLEHWNWVRGPLDARLLLGWIGAAMLGGALDWRPCVWITGDRATGKSTLHSVIRNVIRSMLSVTNSSEAGLRQRLGMSSLPVALDELEAEEDNRRADEVIKLARQASSGGLVLRGGADHKGQEFKARSPFLFSSILLPPLMGQDRSRLAVLELNPLAGVSSPPLDPHFLGQIGKSLLRLLADRWHSFGPRLEMFRIALATHGGHAGRSADQFGTLLACADLLLHQHEPTADELEEAAKSLAACDLQDVGENAADHERCVHHLLTSQIEAFRNSRRHTVAEWVIFAGTFEAHPHEGHHQDNNVLKSFGLAVVCVEDRNWLAVSNNHQGIADLFAGTHWGARSGTTGVWVQALGRVPGSKSHQMKFGAIKARCRLLPLHGPEAILSPDPSLSRTDRNEEGLP